MTNRADPDQLASSEGNWSGSTLFERQGISGFSRTRVKECLNGEQLPKWDFAHVQDDVNLHILRMFEGIFLYRVAHLSSSL